MSLVSGAPFQVCWVVEDLDAAEQGFTDHLGVPAWLRMPGVAFTPDRCRYRGEPADFVIDVSVGWAGEQQVELIRHVSGRSIYVDHGPGLHHVAWMPADFDATVAEAKDRGLTIAQEGDLSDIGVRFAYVDGSGFGAPFVELIEMSEQILGLFESLRQP